MAPKRFGAKTFRRRNVGAKMSAPKRIGAKTSRRQNVSAPKRPGAKTSAPKRRRLNGGAKTVAPKHRRQTVILVQSQPSCSAAQVIGTSSDYASACNPCPYVDPDYKFVKVYGNSVFFSVLNASQNLLKCQQTLNLFAI